MKAKFYNSCNFLGSDKNGAIKSFKYYGLGLVLDNPSVLEHKLGIVVSIFFVLWGQFFLIREKVDSATAYL